MSAASSSTSGGSRTPSRRRKLSLSTQRAALQAAAPSTQARPAGSAPTALSELSSAPASSASTAARSRGEGATSRSARLPHTFQKSAVDLAVV